MTDEKYEEIKAFVKRYARFGSAVVIVNDARPIGEPELLTHPPRIVLHTVDYGDLLSRVTSEPPTTAERLA